MTRRNDGQSQIAISLGICTVRGWPTIEPYVRSLEVASAAADGELVVADGSGRPAPPAGALAATTRWLSFPRSSVYALRRDLLDACQGPVIALTEDHCRVDASWAKALLEAHAEFPEALSIGGPIENIADGHVIDWASFLVVQPGFYPPVSAGLRRKLNHGNVSYKTSALASAPKLEGLGMVDSFHQASLSRQPGAIRIDPRPIVRHEQSLGRLGFMAQHFHAGRTYGSFVRASGGLRPVVRLLAAPAVPWLRLVRALRSARKSRYAEYATPAAPWMLALLFCQVVGQVAGIVAGPGDSPLHVEG